jgi:hypothetical protein
VSNVVSDVGAPKAEGTSIGAPKAEETGSVHMESKPAAAPELIDSPKASPRASGDVGVPKVEGAGTVSSSNDWRNWRSKDQSQGSSTASQESSPGQVGQVSSSNDWSNWRRKNQDDDSGGPTVHQWTPEDNKPAVSTASSSHVEDDKTECPEGTTLNGMTGICDSASVSESSFFSTASIAASMPSGYGTVLAACTASLVGLAVLMNCLPQLRGMLAKFTSSSGTQQAAPGTRFKDIGARRAEEERGLMSGIGDDDEDML